MPNQYTKPNENFIHREDVNGRLRKRYTDEEGKVKTHKPVEEFMDPELYVLFKEFVSQLSGARKVRGFSQKELHRQSGVGESTIGRFEKFQANVSLGTAMQMAKALDLKIVLMPNNVDMEMIFKANSLLSTYSRVAKGHLSE